MKTMRVWALVFLMGCGPQAPLSSTSDSDDTDTTGVNTPAARLIFHKDNFTYLENFATPQNTQYSCLGDVTKVFYATGADFTGSPSALPVYDPTDALVPTQRPAFIRNVSVDMTQTYFPYSQTGLVQTDSCSYRSVSSSANPAPCADFDSTPVADPAPTAAPTSTPSTSPTATPASTPYYDFDYYRVRDDWCISQGPTISPDPDTTKSHVGGVNIDLDRTQLGAKEDLLMMITYQALNSNSAWPSVQGESDETILQVNLIGTGLSLDLLMGQKQPRVWSDANNSQMPIYMRSIATLQDPFSSLRTVQVVLPISANSLIDRIRIERVRGSYFLYQVDLYRLGNRAD